MSSPPDHPTVYSCSSCGNFGIGDQNLSCCEDGLEPVTTPSAISSPTLDELLRVVFDISDTQLEVCLCVMEGGELTVQELADKIGYDRSVISRHLNHLVELNVLNKHRRLLDQGGYVYVYTPVEPEMIRHQFRVEFIRWVSQAQVLIEDLQREKVEMVVEDNISDPQWKIFQ